MSERPILFSGEMVRAILDGRKTQTRRVIKPQPWVDDMGNACWKDRNFGQSANHVPHIKALASPIPCSDTKRVLCPYGKPGDQLWVRETWKYVPSCSHHYVTSTTDPKNPLGAAIYRENIGHHRFIGGGPWRSSIHMPRWASRITLRITDVRVERLQNISEADARAEGAPADWEPGVARALMQAVMPTACFSPHMTGFARLWNQINGPGAWEANPWVWAISFERVKP